jgi:hypothetical protein
MIQIDDFGQAYLRMALEINKHIDGYVDAYFGPPNLKASVEAEDKKPLQTLLDDLAQLRQIIPTHDPARQTYLTAILRAMDCTLRMLNGEQFDYLDQANRLFDISPRMVNEDKFTEAHQELDTLLPGSGSLANRLEMWRKQYEIPKDKLLDLLELTRSETRQRTRALVDLIEDESVEVALTNDQPWSAYNWFEGTAQSRIEFNTDIPVSALEIVELFAHEAYPGHHTQHQLQEKHLYRDKGFVELATVILHSPPCVLIEGAGITAVEVIFPGGSHYDWTAEVLIPTAGLPDISGEELRRILGGCRKLLFYVGGHPFYVIDNAAIKYHSGELTEEQTIDYCRTYGLVTEAQARQTFSILAHPLYGVYVLTYAQGYELIEQAAHGGDKRPLFKRLLAEEMLPSQLATL